MNVLQFISNLFLIDSFLKRFTLQASFNLSFHRWHSLPNRLATFTSATLWIQGGGEGCTDRLIEVHASSMPLRAFSGIKEELNVFQSLHSSCVSNCMCDTSALYLDSKLCVLYSGFWTRIHIGRSITFSVFRLEYVRLFALLGDSG